MTVSCTGNAAPAISNLYASNGGVGRGGGGDNAPNGVNNGNNNIHRSFLASIRLNSTSLNYNSLDCMLLRGSQLRQTNPTQSLQSLTRQDTQDGASELVGSEIAAPRARSNAWLISVIDEAIQIANGFMDDEGEDTDMVGIVVLTSQARSLPARQIEARPCKRARSSDHPALQ
jgi:hypothetical protein